MKLKTLIAADKTGLKTGEWKRGEIPRSAWPSRRAKPKAYKYGPLYQWRIVAFSAGGFECRVRMLLNIDKQIFRATLGVVENGDTKVLCDYEYHASEPGWHCHARCDDLSTIDPSKNRFGSRRLPGARKRHRRSEFAYGADPLNELRAFNCAVEFYRLRERGSLIP